MPLSLNFFEPTFRNTLTIPSSGIVHTTYEDRTDNVSKRRHIKFRRRGITQKKNYNIQNMAKAWNQELNW